MRSSGMLLRITSDASFEEHGAGLSEALHCLQHSQRVVVVAVHDEELVFADEILGCEDGVGGADAVQSESQN